MYRSSQCDVACRSRSDSRISAYSDIIADTNPTSCIPLLWIVDLVRVHRRDTYKFFFLYSRFTLDPFLVVNSSTQDTALYNMCTFPIFTHSRAKLLVFSMFSIALVSAKDCASLMKYWTIYAVCVKKKVLDQRTLKASFMHIHFELPDENCTVGETR